MSIKITRCPDFRPYWKTDGSSTPATGDWNLGAIILTVGGTATGQSSYGEGLVVNNLGGGTASDDFRVETDTVENAFRINARDDLAEINVDLEMGADIQMGNDNGAIFGTYSGSPTYGRFHWDSTNSMFRYDGAIFTFDTKFNVHEYYLSNGETSVLDITNYGGMGTYTEDITFSPQTSMTMRPQGSDGTLIADIGMTAYNWTNLFMSGAIKFYADHKATSLLASISVVGGELIFDDATNYGFGTTTPTEFISLDGTSARTIWMERNTTAATKGQGLTIHAGGAIAGKADLGGGDLELSSGISTGSGNSKINFWTATSGIGGSSDNAPTIKESILGSGYHSFGGNFTPTNLISLDNSQAQKLWIENTASGTVGRALTVGAGSTVGGTNIAGGNLIVQSGVGTGTGASSILFQTGTTLGSGTTLQTMSTKWTMLGSGNFGNEATPTAQLHLKAGTTAARTAQIKLSNSTLMTAPEEGAIERTTDDLYFTIRTGTARKKIVLDNGTALTSGRVPFATTNGRLIDDADLTFPTDT